MRISDWSSDVCSSDLGHEADFGGAPHHVQYGAPRLMGGGDVEEAELVRARRIIDLGLLDRIARVAQVDEVHALDHPAIGDVEAGDRSEEHTSELQSLMRISYAVFCLKKKKQIKNHNKN